MDLNKTGWRYTIFDITDRKMYRDMTSAEVAQVAGVKERSFIAWTGSQTREGSGEDFYKRGILYKDRYLLWRGSFLTRREDEKRFGPGYAEWFTNEWNRTVTPFRTLAARRDRRQATR